MIAPTLTELKQALNVSTSEVAFVYTARSTGYLMGAPLGAFLFSICNRQAVVGTLVALMSVCTALLPVARPMAMFYLLAALSGLSSGGMEAGTNVWLLEIWEDKSCPYMQALHLCFALGCAIAPLLASPFLGHSDSGGAMTVSTAYLINGSVVAAAAIVLITLYFTMKYESPLTAKKEIESDYTEIEMSDKNSSIRPKVVDKVVAGIKSRLPCKKRGANATDVVIFACLTMLFYSGMSIIYSQFMPTYLQNFELHLSAQTASYINSAMYYASTISRAISVPLAMKLSPEYFVYMNCLMLGSGSLLLLLFGGMSLSVTWVGNILIGIGSASVSAPMYSFLKQHIEVTNTIGSIFVFSSGLTSVIYPVLVGHFIEKNPEFLLYLNLVNIALTVFFFSLIYYSVKSSDSKQSPTKRSTEVVKT